MALINLLPWRDERREQRRRQFYGALLMLLLVAAGSILLAERFIGSAIERQVARNQYLAREHARLDERLLRLDEVKAQRQQLLERMQVIERLKDNRRISPRIFDQLVRTLPDGVHFRRVSLVDQTLTIAGVAESNHRVSALLRNLQASAWFAAPSLSEVQAAEASASESAYGFQLTVHPVLAPFTGATP
jgi:type IV pilus assembly protein PilN